MTRDIIAIKPVGGVETASSRLRAFKPCELLKNLINIEIYNEENKDNYKAVIFQKSYTKGDLALAKEMKKRGTTIILDQCDNHNIFCPKNQVEKARAERMQEMSTIADKIFSSTREIANLYPNKPTFVLPDFIDFHDPNLRDFLYYNLKFIHHRLNRRTKIVWFGNAGSQDQGFGLCDLHNRLPWLRNLARKKPIELTIISNSKALYKTYFGQEMVFPINYIAWNNRSYKYFLKMHDVCIIPITKNPFTVCKTNNRIALALSMGLPVVGDAIPSYHEFSEYCILDDWEAASKAITFDMPSLKKQAKKGKEYTSQHYSNENLKKIWLETLSSL